MEGVYLPTGVIRPRRVNHYIGTLSKPPFYKQRLFNINIITADKPHIILPVQETTLLACVIVLCPVETEM